MTIEGQIDLATAPPFRIGPLTVVPALRQVTAVTSETLEPRVMQVLVQLAMANSGIVSRAELVRQCWEGRIVGDDAVNRVIVRLRRLFDQHGDGTVRIETINKVGYRLIGQVVLTAPEARPPLASEGPLASVAADSAPVDKRHQQSAMTATTSTAPTPTSPMSPPVHRYTLWLGALLLIAALVAGWRFLRPSAAPAAKPIVAVLPFTDMSEANGKAYFAEGLAEEILDTLAMDDRLTVLGGNTALAIRENRADPDFAREKLGVTRLLEGSVRGGGGSETVKISVRLIDTADRSEIWSQRFDRSGANIAEVQEEVAQAVAAQLAGTLGSVAPEVAREKAAVPPAAYSKVLVARQLLRTRQGPLILQARALANEAVTLAPEYAAAYAVRSNAEAQARFYTGLPASEMRSAHRDAETAIKLDPSLAEGYAALGRVLGIMLDYKGAIAALQRALALRPDDPETLSTLGRSFAFAGDINRAIVQFEKAAALDPLSVVPTGNLVRFYTEADRGDAALATARRFRAISPDLAEADGLDAFVASSMGQLGRSFMLNRSALARNPRSSNVSIGLVRSAILMFATDRLTATEWKNAGFQFYPQQAYAGNWKVVADPLLRNRPDDLDTIRDVRGIAISMVQSERFSDLVWAFDARFSSVAAYTSLSGPRSVDALLLAHGFQAAGRPRDAKLLRDFARARMLRAEANGMAPSLNAIDWAMLLAAEGDRPGALTRLERGLAVAPMRVCSNDYAVWLGDFRPLTPLFGEARFAAIKTRCRAEINKQRKIAGFPPAVFR